MLIFNNNRRSLKDLTIIMHGLKWNNIMQPIKLGILSSTRGSLMLPIIEAIEEGMLNAQIKVVISDRSDAPILDKARQHNIPAWYISSQGYSPEGYDHMLSQLLVDHHVELGLTINFLRLLSERFVRQWHGKLWNVHPSLLPKFSHLVDLSVHEAVLDAGDTETGCTIHQAEEKPGAGKIITQKRCSVSADDTALALKAKVQNLEVEALIEAIAAHHQTIRSIDKPTKPT